jgi:hypothetical protein
MPGASSSTISCGGCPHCCICRWSMVGSAMAGQAGWVAWAVAQDTGACGHAAALLLLACLLEQVHQLREVGGAGFIQSADAADEALLLLVALAILCGRWAKQACGSGIAQRLCSCCTHATTPVRVKQQQRSQQPHLHSACPCWPPATRGTCHQCPAARQTDSRGPASGAGCGSG